MGILKNLPKSVVQVLFFFHNVVNTSKMMMQVSAIFLQCCEHIKNRDANFSHFSQCCEHIKNSEASFGLFSQCCEHIKNRDATEKKVIVVVVMMYQWFAT